MLTIRIIYITSFLFVKVLTIYNLPFAPLIISNTFQPAIRWHMTQRNERANN